MKTISRNEQIINKKETGSYRIGICDVLPKITEFDSSAIKRSYAYAPSSLSSSFALWFFQRLHSRCNLTYRFSNNGVPGSWHKCSPMP